MVIVIELVLALNIIVFVLLFLFCIVIFVIIQLYFLFVYFPVLHFSLFESLISVIARGFKGPCCNLIGSWLK